ncbi:glutamine amidotransferase-related protein [Legionella hackeliae]|uniref:Putative Glutamine amidotransferase n=1 Tax=Legionella hackeliae TaxID=449 RepID=A0A0A8US30_LEGHA|nr:gamma-glutamyl-gamma-aminobutyrate hydrolase family protein [Legionella hackeliae]KTD13151.1 carbamoyl phosphate synthase small subunit [Legionella hackeliae]CEK11538.1 putative Glutamine amidotransferase [Legionella hackeliae]STX48309.1 carbamoyl phosphate synthase small subunit [Legionella hackeliae]
MPLKHITQQQLVLFIQKKFFSQTRPLGDFDWADNLNAEGFASEFIDINFTEVLEELNTAASPDNVKTFFLMTKGSFTKINFNNCVDIWCIEEANFDECCFQNCSSKGFESAVLKKCIFENVMFDSARLSELDCTEVEFIQCKFTKCILAEFQLDDVNFKDCEFVSSFLLDIADLSIESYSNNKLAKSTLMVNTAWDGIHFSTHYTDEPDKPLLLVLYCYDDGVTYANMLLNFLREKEVDLLLIHPKMGFSHPILDEYANRINGIILPGGPDIPVHNPHHQRFSFEINLLKFAIDKHIPTLGICRGHQLIGYYYGAQVIPMKNHQQSIIHVKPKESKSHNLLQKKYEKYSQSEGEEKSLVQAHEKGGFIYRSECNHSQAVFFKKNSRDKNHIKIVSRSLDNVIEAMEIGDHILTFQHHNEALVSEKNKIAKALLKQYLELVNTHFQNFNHTKKNFFQ